MSHNNRRSLDIFDATETDGVATIQPRPHQQEFRVMIARSGAAIDIPTAPHGTEKTSAPNDRKSGVLVVTLTFRPFIYIPAHVVATVGTPAFRE